MPSSALPFLMFQGDAEEAINHYVATFPNSRIVDLERYATGDQGPEGKLRLALYELAGQHFRIFDSPVAHDFDFTPSFSIFVDCDGPDELERAFATLVEGGKALMPLGDHGFSQRFGWLVDRFGVSWQLNLP